MKIISQYFTKQITLLFIMLLLVLTGLAWMLQIISMMKFLLNYGIELTGFLELTVLMVPFIVSIIVPFVTFIAIIFIYNKMISENEVTVMAGAGMSVYQIAKPAIKFAIIITILHWVLNLWLVPITQANFYDTQWEMRYGLAHLKVQEAAFTQMSEGLVVYVDKVSGYDLSQLMLSDTRNPKTKLTIFAEKGKLVATERGLSIVMSNGSLQASDEGNLTVGTFETFDMDMNVADKEGESVFKVRRISTPSLIKIVSTQTKARQHHLILSELSSRFLSPLMNIILAGLCLIILLRSSLLRRRASIAPVVAVAAMAGTMAAYMSAANMVTSLTGLCILAFGLGIVLLIITWLMFKK